MRKLVALEAMEKVTISVLTRFFRILSQQCSHSQVGKLVVWTHGKGAVGCSEAFAKLSWLCYGVLWKPKRPMRQTALYTEYHTNSTSYPVVGTAAVAIEMVSSYSAPDIFDVLSLDAQWFADGEKGIGIFIAR